MKIVGMILSGGSGKRFGSETPKQYLDINGRPVISYAIEAFQKSNVDEIIIAAGAGFTDRCRQIAVQGGFSKVTDIIEGGSERYYSVMNGLEHLVQRYDEDCIVLIHDGARPFVSANTINSIADAVLECGAAIAAMPCTDTIKIADEEGNIISTTKRSRTFAAQTPQGFWLKDIYRAYSGIIGDEASPAERSAHLADITDDAMVYQMAFPDRKVKIVQSDTSNMKITRMQDLEIAQLTAGKGSDRSI